MTTAKQVPKATTPQPPLDQHQVTERLVSLKGYANAAVRTWTGIDSVQDRLRFVAADLREIELLSLLLREQLHLDDMGR